MILIQEILRRINRLLSFDTTRNNRKRRLQQFFVTAGTSLPLYYLATMWGYTDRPTHTRVQPVSVVECRHCRGNVFTRRCLTMKGGRHFTVPLPGNDRRGTHTHRLMGGVYEMQRWDGLRCHDIHTEFHKDWFRHSDVNRGRFTDTWTRRQH
jgi:hypothetical protein